ncbi:hypothetical protein [Noviherbaspirillum saxi]|uniref:Uncharacterized protein n=1 Tax=Noviherbaspirillum saxi TaxID=2320863 RepID=A0A3A3FNR9_9BURK|nr:hypothetical protein [Noviherbaspirillum saxi]RJF95319.1 hypothetical protein D3871_17965 [Noviherbaspirillum saxi]
MRTSSLADSKLIFTAKAVCNGIDGDSIPCAAMVMEFGFPPNIIVSKKDTFFKLAGYPNRRGAPYLDIGVIGPNAR